MPSSAIDGNNLDFTFPKIAEEAIATMKISTASMASIALLASSANLVLARNGRVLKSSKAGGRGKGKWSNRHDFASPVSFHVQFSYHVNLFLILATGSSSSTCGSGLPAKDSMTPEAKCDVFRAYHDSEVYIAQNSDRRALAADDVDAKAAPRILFPDTPVLCEALAPLDPYLCPGVPRIAKICTEPRIDTNRAVKERYCEPLFRDICDDEERDECVRRCIQYVSPIQGDCCGISEVDCDDYPLGPGNSSSGKGSKGSKGGKGGKGGKGSKS